MLPDPHVAHFHRGGRTEITSGCILQDDKHRRGSDARGQVSDIDAVIVIGDASRLPVRGKSMPPVRIVHAGAANTYSAGIIRAMEVRTDLTVNAFRDVVFTVFRPVLAI